MNIVDIIYVFNDLVKGFSKYLPHCWRASEARRHSQVCSIENRDRLEKWFPLRGERAHSLKLFCMYDKRFEISKTK